MIATPARKTCSDGFTVGTSVQRSPFQWNERLSIDRGRLISPTAHASVGDRASTLSS